MRITDELRRFPGFPQPVYSMDTGGNGGGDDDGFDGNLEDSIFDQSGGIDGNDDNVDDMNLSDDGDEFDDGDFEDSDADGEITGDASAILKKLFAQPKPKGNGRTNQNDSDDGDGDNDEPTPEQIQLAIATELDTGIKGLALAENLIPEDFDPNNRQQLRTLLNNVQQTTARNAISLMFQPMQVAMGRMVTQLRREMQETASTYTQNSAAEQMLRAQVPAARSPEYRPMVNFVFDQAKKRFPGNLNAQVKMTAQTMSALGIRSGSRAPRGSRPGNGSGAKTGTSALDVFAPIPKPQSQNRGGNRGNGNSMMRQFARLMAQGGK